MSVLVNLKTEIPLALDQQIKTRGKHENLPLSNLDAYRAIAAGVHPIAIDEDGNETELTFDNVDELISPSEDIIGEEVATDKDS